MITPLPHQLSGAAWLSGRKFALLADEPRVGKTGAAILAADDLLIDKILVVTTASGRPVWWRAFREWSPWQRKGLRIVGWPELNSPRVRSTLLGQSWDLLILDESHFAKNFDAKRTQAVYGELIGDTRHVDSTKALASRAKAVWCLSGTPVPNACNDIFPMMRALCPEELLAKNGWPDVTAYPDFLKRYCIVAHKKVGYRKIPVVVGGRNLEELAKRIQGHWLRRTQQEVGIRPPIYETYPLPVTAAMRYEADRDLDKGRILAAANAGNTRELAMHMGPVRRLTGVLKAQAVIAAVIDEFNSGTDKIVLAYWHRDVGAALLGGLAAYGVVGIDGATTPARREENLRRFAKEPQTRVFLAQIAAAGEAIDLSAAAELMFVESSFTPKDMSQMSKRITNFGQQRQARVRVATLAGSIDGAMEEILLRKWSAIREVLK